MRQGLWYPITVKFCLEIGSRNDGTGYPSLFKTLCLTYAQRAIPMVAIVVHELPVITDTNAQIMQVEARKNSDG